MNAYLVSAYNNDHTKRVIVGICETQEAAEQVVADFMNSGKDYMNVDGGSVEYTSKDIRNYKVQSIYITPHGKVEGAVTLSLTAIEKGEWVPEYKTVITGITYKTKGYLVKCGT
jgi:hypothetical protein